MIKSVLIFNNFGKPRLLRFFEQLDSNSQQNVLRETFMLISKRSSSNCNFLEGSKQIKNQDLKIIYRQYATLYFVFVVDKSESELGTLDLIHLFVETLNRVFDDVCELDLVKLLSFIIKHEHTKFIN
ncbi:hypothetical protein BB558_002195 [Smittium angustum]|uniref:AP complex subunit sigma n=1 Tax=Smittium angustum TaxID=133377 RepID=A0A2U1J9C0_SMIAN|nr:hypothetical protein BB558_002195 [Smittium angustum]